jgi:hypothetical protein
MRASFRVVCRTSLVVANQPRRETHGRIDAGIFSVVGRLVKKVFEFADISSEFEGDCYPDFRRLCEEADASLQEAMLTENLYHK